MIRCKSQEKWIDKIDDALRPAEDTLLEVGHATALLQATGRLIGAPNRCRESQKLGLQVAYLARQIDKHAEGLSSELAKIDRAAGELRRQDEPAPAREINGRAAVREV